MPKICLHHRHHQVFATQHLQRAEQPEEHIDGPEFRSCLRHHERGSADKDAGLHRTTCLSQLMDDRRSRSTVDTTIRRLPLHMAFV